MYDKISNNNDQDSRVMLSLHTEGERTCCAAT